MKKQDKLEKKVFGCVHLKQKERGYPPYCIYKGYCDRKFDYAGTKYCKEMLR